MLRVTSFALALLMAIPAVHQPAEASQKKQVQKKAQATGKSRADYTPEQRKQIMERARQVCRDKYGAPTTVYRVDFKAMRVWCVPPGAG